MLVSGKNQSDTSEILNRDLNKISTWASNWKIIFNAEKSKTIIFSKNKHNYTHPVQLQNNTIDHVTVHKHLGVYLTYNLDWTEQIKYICLSANRKLSVLRRVRYLQRSTLDLLYKITVRSVLDYGLVIFYNSLNQISKKRLDQLQYNAAKLVSGALHLTSRVKLETELGWESISKRAEFLGLTLFHKINRLETRPLIRSCMPDRNPRKLNDDTNISYRQFPFKSMQFANSFFPYYTKKWNKLPHAVKLKPTDEFKNYQKTEIKPKKYKFYSKGNKYNCTLLTRIRIGRSYLNAHSFQVGHSDTMFCKCGYKEENSVHYITQCPLYTEARRTMVGRIEQFIPRFRNLTNKKQYEILVHGYERDNDELKSINTKIMISTQIFINETKRFKY